MRVGDVMRDMRRERHDQYRSPQARRPRPAVPLQSEDGTTPNIIKMFKLKPQPFKLKPQPNSGLNCL
jgi:hypothetical protein